MHDVLSDWHRRAILYHLQEHERAQPLSVASVARQLLEWNPEHRSPADDEAAVERVRSRILHGHVLEMAEFGILGYDPETDSVWISDSVTVAVSPPRLRQVDADAPSV